MRYNKTPFDSLYLSASPEACWIWKGSFNSNGYGWHFIGSERIYAHVFALTRKQLKPSPNHFACHTCDNPACVNPNHLYWGTPQENMTDMYNRKRNGQHKILKKLSKEQVIEIYNATGTMRDIATRYGVSRQTVCNIKNKQGYAFL